MSLHNLLVLHLWSQLKNSCFVFHQGFHVPRNNKSTPPSASCFHLFSEFRTPVEKLALAFDLLHKSFQCCLMGLFLAFCLCIRIFLFCIPDLKKWFLCNEWFAYQIRLSIANTPWSHSIPADFHLRVSNIWYSTWNERQRSIQLYPQDQCFHQTTLLWPVYFYTEPVVCTSLFCCYYVCRFTCLLDILRDLRSSERSVEQVSQVQKGIPYSCLLSTCFYWCHDRTLLQPHDP